MASGPQSIGSYELIDVLGRGGMGEVWRARHRLLGRDAAVKIIRPEHLGHPDSDKTRTILRRFEREAQATARLTSSHTVKLYDFGTTPDGAFYYAMELLDGIDLRTLVEQHGPLPPARVVYLALQMCDSLAEAHAAGLIHRDVKPANILVCRQGLERDFVKLLDFGLVKSDPAIVQETRLTAEGLATGSPAFMAPEAIEGDAPVDARVDVYALGCVLSWLLTGRLVFEIDGALKMMMAHLQNDPEPPSAHAPDPVPAELDALVLACLEKDRARRPASMEDVVRRLEAVPLQRPWSRAQARAWWESAGNAEVVRTQPSDPAGVDPTSPAPAPSPGGGGGGGGGGAVLRLDPDTRPHQQPGRGAVAVKTPAAVPKLVVAQDDPPVPAVIAQASAPAADGIDPARIPKPLSAPMDARRSQVILKLRHAFEVGAVNLDELDERLSLAENARNEAELHVLTHDLPREIREASEQESRAALPALRPEAKAGLPVRAGRDRTMTMTAVFSAAETGKGPWTPPAKIKARAIFGGVQLDFRKAQLEPGEVVDVACTALFGGVDIRIPKNVRVESHGFGLFGYFAHVHQEAEDPNAPLIRLHGRAIFGGVDVSNRKAGRWEHHHHHGWRRREEDDNG